MAECFEITFVTKSRVDLKSWEREFSIGSQKSIYSGGLSFFNGKEVSLYEYNNENLWEYEFSLNVDGLFLRDKFFENIFSLLDTVEAIWQTHYFGYAIGNIELNSSLISKNSGCISPSLEILLNSALIFLSEDQMKDQAISVYHLIFKKHNIVCLYNIRYGLLFDSKSETYKILKESFH